MLFQSLRLRTKRKHLKTLSRRSLRCFTNPFSEQSNDLFNLVTKVVVPEKIKKDLCNQSQIGQKLFEAFVCDRIQSNKTNLWASMKKHTLSTWKDMGKKMKLSAGDKWWSYKRTDPYSHK